jgi:hypothetical protein
VEGRAAANGGAASAPVNALIPIPSSNAAFGHTLSTITTRRCTPANGRT